MKKLTLLTCAFVASTMAFAQDDVNLALNKTAMASSVSDENTTLTADKAVDGNLGTKWASNYYKTDVLGESYDKDDQWIYVDLGESKSVNTIKMNVDNQPAANFDIRIAETITDNDPTTSGTAVLTAQSSNAGYNTYKFNTTTGRYVIIDFNTRSTDWGYGINELEVYNRDYSNLSLTTFTASPTMFKAGEEVELTFTALDQYNENMEGVTYWVGSKEITDNKLTAETAGEVTITAECGDVTKTITLYALSDDNAPTAPAADEIVTPVYSNTDTKNNANVAWNGDYDEKADVSMDELMLGGQVVKPIGAAGKLFIGNTLKVGEGEKEETIFGGWTIDYTPNEQYGTTLHVDLFTAKNATGRFNFEQSGIDDPIIKTNGGEWTSFDIDVAKATKLHTITLMLDKVDGVYPDVLVANVYFSNKEVTEPSDPKTPTISDNPNERGVYTLTGEAKTADEVNKLLNDVKKTAYNLTELTLANDITSLNVANPNAMIIVTEAQAAQLSGMKNLCTINDRGYLYPENQYELTDGYPVYTAFFISCGDTGYKYTRKFTESKYVTTYLPTGTTVSEGITAYTFASATDSNNETVYTFNKVENGALAAKTPYILYVTAGTELTAIGTSDLNMTGDDISNNLGETNVAFNGTFNTFVGDGNQYGLYNNTDEESIVLKKVNGGTIGAFRGYFTINDGINDAKSIRLAFSDGNTTGINTVATESVKAAGVYSIDGRFINADGSVKNLAKGLYIVNGKKVIVK